MPEVMTPALNPALPSVVTPGSTPASSPEDQLCLLLARGELTSEVRSRILDSLATPLRWPTVMERARSHQVYPLLYRNLRELGFPGVPEAVQTELKGLFLANALRNRLLAEELSRLLRLLSEAGVRVIPLKGVALAQSLFGDPAARVCADIDILVPPTDLGHAMDVIFASGYRTEHGDPFFSKLLLRHGRHHDVVRDQLGISFHLEVHWNLVQHSSRNEAAVNDLWADARPRDFFGAPAFSLTPEWEFLYLSIHAADHEWQCLKWLVDIHQLASSGVVDWDKTMRKAERFEIDFVLRQTLAASSLLFGTPVPAGCLPATLPAGVQLFAHVPLPAGAAESAFSFRHLRVLRRSLDKLRYLAEVILVPRLTDRDFLRLPPSLGFLYYVIRPPRLAFKWAASVMRKPG
ncbi:MAG: nucleotidyltransferase domain-containing protein [Terriglobales bacterium]